ncbi:syndecan-4-like [Carassius carassius]|uniref:syndecan-4-like n=1 Tax=Carassius carassius TaxID=217509 RepID=UPI00286844A5|nr:syndecan-4-like [Carassius carassius]
MLKVYLMLVLSLAAAVFAESVRETETWIPLKNKSPQDDLESSGDYPNEDFETTNLNPIDDEDGDDDDDDDDDEAYDYSDGSGSGFVEGPIDSEIFFNSNQIPELKGSFKPKPTVNNKVLIESNEVGFPEESKVHMTHAGDDSLFNNTEVLAAVIAGAAVGLAFAILLIVLLVHFVLRIKKKDEGSYDLGKTPIYKKAPTTEFYA